MCAQMCDILFILSGSAEIVQCVKSLVKSGIPNRFRPDTILRFLKNVGIIQHVFPLRHNKNMMIQGGGPSASERKPKQCNIPK